MKCIKRITSLIMLIVLFVSISGSAFALSAPGNLSAQAIVVADMDTGIILYEKNMNQRRSPASLTKIMTGLLAVEAVERGEISYNDIITAPNNCWEGMDLDSSNIEISPGEKMTFKDYFYAAMVKSANEACNVIAMAIDGSLQGFVNRMNLRANELGCYNTFFSDTNGLSNKNHYTTAHDLYLITAEAMKHEVFVDAVNTIDYEIEETNLHAKRYINSSNALLCQDGLYGDGYLYLPASGVKTGYTNAAGYCLVSTASKNDKNLLCVVLGCNGPLNTGDEGYGNFAGTIALYDWAFKNFEFQTIAEKGQVMEHAQVKLSKNNKTASLRSVESVKLLLPRDVREKDVIRDITLYNERLTAPIKCGTLLGEMKISIYNQEYATIKLYTAEDIEADAKELIIAKADEILQNPKIRIAVIISAIILLVIIYILIHYSVEKRRHIREIAKAEERRYAQKEWEDSITESLKAQKKMMEFRNENNENNERE